MLSAAERVIRQASPMPAPKVSTVTDIVREEIGTEDVFLLGEHIEETQFGIDNHHSDLLSLVVSVFLKIRLHHITKLTSLELQKGSTRKNCPLSGVLERVHVCGSTTIQDFNPKFQHPKTNSKLYICTLTLLITHSIFMSYLSSF